jgi:steroid 5-alpha reductase family enzyme
LGTHLLKRILKHYPEEDGRYVELRRTWNANLRFKFFIFYLMQGLSIVLMLTPFTLVAVDTNSALESLHFIAIALWFIAFCGESLADNQLKKFKTQPQNMGKVCDVGLWYYSRHPNYFFEWLIWCSFALFALASPYGWLGLISPIIIFYLLFKVTGIPMAEAQALKTKKEKYAKYQLSTSVFVPWFKKKG